MSGRPPSLAERLRDERGILIAALVRLVIFFALLGLVLFEAGSVIWSRLSVQDTADAAATTAVTAYRDSKDVRVAEQEALRTVEDKDETAQMTFFQVHADGSVTVRVRKTAQTLVIQHVGFLDGFTKARGSATIEPPSF
ncbi:MAG TPA: hypothetical protein VF058_09950 [Actinomycetota bacterium]